MPQYFAAFQPFEVFEEFNGVQGTYIKSFLISDIVNLNKWQTTHEANIANLDTFLGRPGIHYINDEGKRDHTGATSFEKSLQLQELYRAASIIAVGSDIATKQNWQISKMVDDDVAQKIISKEIKWISPSIWPDEGAVEILEHTDGSTVDRVHDYKGLHYAFVDEPAYGVDAEIKAFCDGTTKQCQIELQQFDASIDTVGPITDKKLIIPKKDKDSSKQQEYTSHNESSTSKTQMATEEELRKELEEAKKALKATNEELDKLKEKEAKLAQDEEEEKEDSEAKKAQDEEEKKDDEEKTALKARIEVLERQPIVKEIVASQLSAGILSEDKVSETTSQLMQASKGELNRTLNTSKAYEAKLNSASVTASQNVGFYGSTSNGAFDASLDSINDEELLLEVSGSQ